MNRVVKYTVNGLKYIEHQATEALERNNTFVPDITRTIFNLKTEDDKPVLGEDGKPTGKRQKIPLEKPILSTTVFFNDGSRVTVKNSANDPVELDERELPDGTTTFVASRRSKELAIVHAVMKRVIGEIDGNGVVDGRGYGRILTDIVDSGYDQSFETTKSKIEKAAKKKAYEEQKKTAKKPASKRYSFAEIAQLLGPIAEKIASNPNILAKLG